VSASSSTATRDVADARNAGQQTVKKRSLFSRPVTWMVLIGLLIVVGGYGTYWWTVARFFQSTDDAYLRADQVAMAPRVSGYVSDVLVVDNQAVTAGQVLIRIDPSTYQATLAQQVATRQSRLADVVASEADYQQQQAGVEQAQAKLVGDQANLRFAEQQVTRYHGLAASGAEPPEKLASMVNQRDQAAASVQMDTAALDAAQKQVATAKAKIGQAQAQVVAAQAAVDAAQLDVDHTEVKASIDGMVGDKTVQVGQYVQPGSRLLSLVPVRDVYVVANFKETQVGRMRIGQHASVTVDALDGRTLDAVVQSFAPGTGAQFALLPPENATGNFTKIVQRVPVRLRLQVDKDTLAQLMPGLSVDVEIDTRQHGTLPEATN
jgi:membrane fusion protein, multidrug efflux system